MVEGRNSERGMKRQNGARLVASPVGASCTLATAARPWNGNAPPTLSLFFVRAPGGAREQRFSHPAGAQKG